MAELDYASTYGPPSPIDGVDDSGPRATPAGWKRALRGLMPLVMQRLAFGGLVLLAIIYLTYLGLDMARGADFLTAAKAAIPDTLAYIGNLLRGDLGVTTAGSITILAIPISDVILETLPRSLGLLGISLFFSMLIGVVIGTLAARRGARHSIWLILTTIIGISIPSFFAAFLLQWGLTTYTRLAGRPLLPVGGFGWDSHLVLPVVVLSARPIAQITRITFVAIQDAARQDYTRTAVGKGLRRVQVMSVHVMRNAAIPILTTIGVSLSFMLSSLPVVELYFGWPGVGATLLKAIARQDDNLTIALLLCLGALFVLVHLVLELSYRFIDPRLLEVPPHINIASRQKPIDSLKALGDDLRSLLVHNPLSRLFAKRHVGQRPEEAGVVPEPEMAVSERSTEGLTYRRTPLKPVFRNLPLLAGGFLVLVLLILIFFGPDLSPNNPYNMQGLVSIDGALTPPPFAPDETYPWGTDALGRGLMSLIFTGAQQTLVLAILAVGARAVVGITLGAIAGWRSGGLVDRLIQGVAEIIAAYPALLLTMIVILALGIRQGMSTFVIALCVVGWGEIMQFVRAEIGRLRPEPFIESAVAVGARTPRIVSRHMMPHLFSALISILALEMGAVLMLLGELGFIGIFIGGGTLIFLPSQSVHYSDVPEWGAMLSNIRHQVRSYPWTGLYPMLAFFLAILSFNLFAEGFRRLVEEGQVIIHRVFNRYTFGLAVLVIVSFNWLQSNRGSNPFYREYAQTFDGAQALTRTAVLTNPGMEGRSLGTDGLHIAAEYLAAEFKALGLQAAGDKGTYLQHRARAFERLEEIPQLAISDGGPALTYGEDYAAYPGRNVTAGKSSGRIRVVLLGERLDSTPGVWRQPFPTLERMDYSKDILLVMDPEDAWTLTNKAKQGMLVVADDPDQLSQRYTLSGRTGRHKDWQTGEISGEETPYLWISEATADRLLAGSGHDVRSLRAQGEKLAPEELFDLPLDQTVKMAVEGTLIEKSEVVNVIGVIPGAHGYDLCTDCLGQQLIVIMAQYDTPPPGPEGIYPGANDNASGVAVMLEALRVIHESEYYPNKTLLFVAYSGEGLEGGEPISQTDVQPFLQSRRGYATGFRLEAILNVGPVGAGQGDSLEIAAGGSLRLADLFERAGKQMGVRVQRAKELIDIGVIYEEGSSFSESGQDAPQVYINWQGWQAYSRTPGDRLEVISAEKLRDAGRTLAMALMILGREINY